MTDEEDADRQLRNDEEPGERKDPQRWERREGTVSTEAHLLRAPTKWELSLFVTFCFTICGAYLAIHELVRGGPVFTTREILLVGTSLGVATGGSFALSKMLRSRATHD